MQVCKSVKLRMRDRRNGTKSLFLDFWPGYRDPETMELIRRRSLGLYIYANPTNAQQKQYNEIILSKAEAIRCRVFIDVIRDCRLILRNWYWLTRECHQRLPLSAFFLSFVVFWGDLCIVRTQLSLARGIMFDRYLFRLPGWVLPLQFSLPIAPY